MFEITIKEIKSVTKLTRGEHTIIDERPYTDEELSKANSVFAASYDKAEPKGLKRVYGYAPDREEEKTTEREILKQSVEELDLAGVIKAVNKL